MKTGISSQEKTCFYYREPLLSLQGPCLYRLYYRDFPVNPCTSLLGIAVQTNFKSAHLLSSEGAQRGENKR